MRYTIFSIGSIGRESYIRSMEDTLRSWDRVTVKTVNGNKPGQLFLAMKKHDIPIGSHPFTVGQLGIWHSVLNALEAVGDSPLVTFEDDALLSDNFTERFAELWPQVPADCDFFSLFMPADWRNTYYTGRILNRTGDIIASLGTHPEGNALHRTTSPNIAKAYQKYGGVSMVYTPSGAKRILERIRETGLTEQYDDYLYRQSRLGFLNGYTVAPVQPDMVYITGTEQTTVHETALYH